MSWLDRLFPGRLCAQRLVDAGDALPGRESGMPVPAEHLVLHHPLRGETSSDDDTGIGDVAAGREAVILAGGCFWGVEEVFWETPGVYTTAVGYAGGYTPNPTYEEVCTSRTGHTEAVLVVFDPAVIALEGVLAIFWELHDPTQQMRQGNDVGTQYRSAIYTFTPQDADLARRTARTYQSALAEAGRGGVATEIAPLAEAGDGHFYYAESYHQQYLAKNPYGYRCHGATGVRYPA